MSISLHEVLIKTCIQQHICRLRTKANGLAMNFHFCISYVPGLLNPIMFPKQYLLFTNNGCCYQLFSRPAGVFMAEEIFWAGQREEEMPCVKGIGLKTVFTVAPPMNTLRSCCLLSYQYSCMSSGIGFPSHVKTFISQYHCEVGSDFSHWSCRGQSL